MWRKWALCGCLVTLAGPATGQTPADDPHWSLVFEDNFDSLDTERWKVANHFDHYGEPQVYTDRTENVSVRDGQLVLQVIKEPYRCRDLAGWACNKRWYDYTSGWVETQPAADIRYGYIEARVKLPHGQGFWPAFWTFVRQGEGRHGASEIDIFEMLGDRPPTVMGTNLHVAYCKCGENPCDCRYLHDMKCPEIDPGILCHQLDVEIPDYREYHTYAVEWTPTRIIWYVDGRMVRNSFNPGITDTVRIIMNLAIAPWSLPGRTTPFPARMVVDHVKMYKLNQGTVLVDSCLADPEGIGGKVPERLSIGGDSCSRMVPPGKRITLRATEEIEIKGEFSVPLGAGVYLDVSPVR